ncbi:MAG: tetratricopeptide repeat protein [Bacteroidia bacterium]|nr:tetratricopeptide repeat protein [Bacteroidia bacterium]
MQDRHLAITDSFGNIKNFKPEFYYLDTLLHKVQAIKDKKFEAIVWMSKGNFFLGTGNSFSSIESFRKSIKLWEELNYYSGVCNAYTNLGNTYFYMLDYDKALMYYKTAISYCKKITDPKSNKEGKLANLYNNMGSLYCSMDDFVYGKTYFNLALNVWLKTKDSLSISYIYNNYAQIFNEQKNYDSSMVYYFKALRIKNSYGTLLDKADAHLNIGGLYLVLKKLPQALEYTTKALSFIDTNSYSRHLISCYNNLNRIYHEKKDYKNELKYFKLYSIASDSANSREKISSITKMEMQYEFSKIHLADSIKSVEEIKLKDLKISAKNTQTYFLVFILLLTIVALSLIYSRFKLTKKQKLIIEEKNKEITDSITYAKKIQNSIMPNESYISREMKRLNEKKKG